MLSAAVSRYCCAPSSLRSECTWSFLACNAVVDELQYAIKHTDQKKTLDMGSQRLSSDGSVDKRAVKYAGSEVHLIELMENIW